MQVNYCDLCSAPLKENNFWMLYISEPRNTNYGETEYIDDYIKRVQKGVKEICPGCKHIFDKMFELRLERLSELSEEILNLYKLQSKQNPKERKNGKDKK